MFTRETRRAAGEVALAALGVLALVTTALAYLLFAIFGLVAMGWADANRVDVLPMLGVVAGLVALIMGGTWALSVIGSRYLNL